MQARMNIGATAADGIHALRALESYVNSCRLPDSLLDLLRLRVSQIKGAPTASTCTPTI